MFKNNLIGQKEKTIMKDFHNINMPVITTVTATVSIRLWKPIKILKGTHDIYFWENRFNQIRRTSKTLEDARSYDICRAILKLASNNQASLQGICMASHIDDAIEFTFSFPNLEAFNNFEKKLYICAT